jgi:acetyl esterase/lipase
MMLVLKTIAPWLVAVLGLVGLGLSLWIVLPAPIFALLPLSVGMPEIGTGLAIVNAAILILGWGVFNSVGWSRSPWGYLLLGTIAFSLVLSLLPLLQFYPTHRQIERTMARELGDRYLDLIPPAAMAKMRSQPFNIVDTWRGIPLPPVRTSRRIQFANPDNIPLYINIYRPIVVGKYPTIVSIYGGAWQRGKPDDDEKFNRYIASQGYVVWAIDYRHAPAYRFPVQLEDVRTALAFIQRHPAAAEADFQRLAIMGRSAGSQLAMLAAFVDPIVPVRAIVGYYGPVNLKAGYYDVPVPDPIETRSTLETYLGGNPQQLPELYDRASPINAVRENLPPSLLIYGKKDCIVPAKFGKKLADRLRSTGNKTIFIEIPWADHAFDAVFSGISNQLAIYHTERFLDRTLKN